jgi:hypothetical protein
MSLQAYLAKPPPSLTEYCVKQVHHLVGDCFVGKNTLLAMTGRFRFGYGETYGT